LIGVVETPAIQDT